MFKLNNLTVNVLLGQLQHWTALISELISSVHKELSFRRDRAMLRIIEYFAKSLKIAQGHSKWHHWVGYYYIYIYSSLFTIVIKSVSRTASKIFRVIMAWTWNLGKRSFKVIKSSTTQKLGYCFLFALHSNYGPILKHCQDKARYCIRRLR